MNPQALAGIGLFAAVMAAATIAGWRMRRHTKPPVPGHTPSAAAGPPAGGRAPAPGYRHGGIAYSIRTWNCGRIRIWDGDGNITYAHGCACPPLIDWARHEKELAE